VRENVFYDVVVVADMADCQRLQYGVKGRFDRGYGSTCRMLSETGIALLSCDKPGGIGTPGSCLGEDLVKRLEEHAELTFAVEG
jgi:short subunit dehydrogenase-like uncharacterized protein